MIYLDYAATAPLLPEAKQAMSDALDLFGNPSSAHTAGGQARAVLSACRQSMAESLSCEPEELIFTSGGTESNALALHGAGKHTAVGALEHPSVHKNLPNASVLPSDRDGAIDMSRAEQILCKDTELISVQYANNELGTLQPVAALGELCKRAGALFHTDAVQAVGHVPITLCRAPFDLLSLSAHKFGGPKGVGALWRKQGTALSPLLRGGMQEHGMRAGTENICLICGMTAALKCSVRDMEREAARLTVLRDDLQTRLQALGGIVNGTGKRLPSHLNIRFPGQDAEALLHALDLWGFCVSAGAACSSAKQTPSDVLLAIGLTDAQAKSSLRISIGKETTQKDIRAFCEALEHLIHTAT